MRKETKHNTLIGATTADRERLSKLAHKLNIPAYKVLSVMLVMVENSEIDIKQVRQLLVELKTKVETRIGSNRNDVEKLAKLSRELRKPAYRIASVLISMLEKKEVDETRVKELALTLNA